MAPRPVTAQKGVPLREILASPKMLAIMIMAMGGIVGFIAMSIILPIFKMSQLVK